MNTKISLLAACAALACLAAHADPVLDRNARVSGNGNGSADGSTTWTRGSGFSRSGSCTDSGGNTVTCGTPR